MQNLFFEPSGYFDDKLKKREKKQTQKLHRQSSTPTTTSRVSYSTPVAVTPTSSGSISSPHTNSKHHRRSRSSQSSKLSTKLFPSSAALSLHDDASLINVSKTISQRNRLRTGSGGRSSVSSSSMSSPLHSHNARANGMSDDVFEAYKKKLARKHKQNRGRSVNSNGMQTIYSVEKERITKNKFSRLFYDFETTKSIIDQSERDQNFRQKLQKLNEQKQKNKADSYELIRQYFTSILDRKHSHHPLAMLITKFCNLFHGQYSFSPEDFRDKSISQIVDQKRLRRRGSKRTTTDIFDDSGNNKNQSKVVRKTSKRLDKATEDVKNFIAKLRSLIVTLYPELKALKTYKYVVQSVFHKELFSQLTPTLGDLYSIKTEDKQHAFAKYMGMWQSLACRDFGASDDFVRFCLIPSMRPSLLTDTKDEHVHDADHDHKEAHAEQENDAVCNVQTTDSDPTAAMSGLAKQLQTKHNEPVLNTQHKADSERGRGDEKESEVVHNAEPMEEDAASYHQQLTEQVLREFDDNYAISQLLNERKKYLRATLEAADDGNVFPQNTNFAVPSYVAEYNMEEDEDDESFRENISSTGSIGAYTPIKENGHSFSSADYEANETIHESPDSSVDAQPASILPQISDETEVPANHQHHEKEAKKSRISSIFSAFSTKKKPSKKQRSNSADFKINVHLNDSQHFDHMHHASKLIEHTLHTDSSQPADINISPTLKAQKRQSSASGGIKVIVTKKHSAHHHHQHHRSSARYRDNIDNITKQMLAGSHAGRIANQLHNINNRRATVDMFNSESNHAEQTAVALDSNHHNMNASDSSGVEMDGIDEELDPHSDVEAQEEMNMKDEDKKDDEEEDKAMQNRREEEQKEEKESEERTQANLEQQHQQQQQEEKHNPYLEATLEIKKMTQFDTPEDKIQCVVRTADIIRETIDKFYENRMREPIQITPDDLLSLFAYILTQANLHCLWAEVDLIDDFVVDNLRMDMPGYYIATLRAAMQLIVNDIEKLTETALKKRSSKQMK